MHVGHSQPALQATSWPKICRNRLPGMAHIVAVVSNPLSIFCRFPAHPGYREEPIHTHILTYTHKKDTPFTGHLASTRLHEIINGCLYNRLLLTLGHMYVYVLLNLQCVCMYNYTHRELKRYAVYVSLGGKGYTVHLLYHTLQYLYRIKEYLSKTIQQLTTVHCEVDRVRRQYVLHTRTRTIPMSI